MNTPRYERGKALTGAPHEYCMLSGDQMTSPYVPSELYDFIAKICVNSPGEHVVVNML